MLLSEERRVLELQGRPRGEDQGGIRGNRAAAVVDDGIGAGRRLQDEGRLRDDARQRVALRRAGEGDDHNRAVLRQLGGGIERRSSEPADAGSVVLRIEPGQEVRGAVQAAVGVAVVERSAVEGVGRGLGGEHRVRLGIRTVRGRGRIQGVFNIVGSGVDQVARGNDHEARHERPADDAVSGHTLSILAVGEKVFVIRVAVGVNSGSRLIAEEFAVELVTVDVTDRRRPGVGHVEAVIVSGENRAGRQGVSQPGVLAVGTVAERDHAARDHRESGAVDSRSRLAERAKITVAVGTAVTRPNEVDRLAVVSGRGQGVGEVDVEHGGRSRYRVARSRIDLVVRPRQERIALSVEDIGRDRLNVDRLGLNVEVEDKATWLLARNSRLVEGVARGVDETAKADRLGVHDQLVTTLIEPRQEGQVDSAGIRGGRRSPIRGRNERRGGDEPGFVGVGGVVEVDELVVADVARDRRIKRGERDLRRRVERGGADYRGIHHVERKLRQRVQVGGGGGSQRERRGARSQRRGHDLGRGGVDPEGRFRLRREARQRRRIRLSDHNDADVLEALGKGGGGCERERAVGVGRRLNIVGAGVTAATLRSEREIAAVITAELNQHGQPRDGPWEARRHLPDEARLIERRVVVTRDAGVAGGGEIQRGHHRRGQGDVREVLNEVLVFSDAAWVAVTRGEDAGELTVETIARGVGNSRLEGRLTIGAEDGLAVGVENLIPGLHNQRVATGGELGLIEIGVVKRRGERGRVVADLESRVVVEVDPALRRGIEVGEIQGLGVDRCLIHRLAELNREDTPGVGRVDHLRHDRVFEREALGGRLERLAVGGDHVPLDLVGEVAVARLVGFEIQRDREGDLGRIGRVINGGRRANGDRLNPRGKTGENKVRRRDRAEFHSLAERHDDLRGGGSHGRRIRGRDGGDTQIGHRIQGVDGVDKTITTLRIPRTGGRAVERGRSRRERGLDLGDCDPRTCLLEQRGDGGDVRRGRRGSKEAREILRKVRGRGGLAWEGGLRRVDDFAEERRVAAVGTRHVGIEVHRAAAGDWRSVRIENGQAGAGRAERFAVQGVRIQIGSRSPPGHGADADGVDPGVVTAGAGIIGAAGVAELLRNGELAGLLLRERQEFHVSGVGARLHVDDDRVGSRVRNRDDLNRLLSGNVVVRARSNDRTRGVDDVEVDFRGHRRGGTGGLLRGERLVELKLDGLVGPRGRHGKRGHRRARGGEVHEIAGADVRDGGRDTPILREIAAAAAEVTGRGEVGHAAVGDRVNRLRDDTVLEERFAEVGDVVDNHAGLAGRGEGLDIVGHREIAPLGGRERKVRPGRDVVDVFQHRSAFVGASGRSVLEDIDVRGKVARLHRVGQTSIQLAHAVRQDADSHPRAGDSKLRSGGVRLE